MLIEKALQKLQLNEMCQPNGIHKELVNQAQVELEELQRMHLLKIAIASLDQKTIAEIRSFDQPKPEIVDCMKCVFLLLGTPIKDVQTWKQLRGLIGKMGKESLKRKINEFTVANVGLSKKVVAEAKKLNAKVDVARVSEVSTGATAFYAWCTGVLEELN